MLENVTYVQTEVKLELNKNILNIAGRYLGHEILENGLRVWYEEIQGAGAFSASGLEDLNTFYEATGAVNNSSVSGKIYDIRFSIVSEDVIRVSINCKHADRGLFVKAAGSTPSFDIKDNDDCVTVLTPKLQLIVNKENAGYSVINESGTAVLMEKRDDSSIYYGYYNTPLGREKIDSDMYTCQSFKRSYDEDFYGFGEQFTDFNKRGQVMEIWNVDPGNTMSYMSYKNIPFFLSTKGYGLLLNSSRQAIFDMGSKSSSAYSLKVEGDELDYFIILGSSLKSILKKYYLLTGSPALPPVWSFGLWMSTYTEYRSDEAMISIAQELREKKLPCDVLHIDPPWMNMNSLVCNLEWGENFKKREEMIKVLRDKHFKLSLWIAPYVPFDCDMFKEGMDGGFFVKDKNGKLIVNKGPMNFWSPEFVYVDFTNPDAEAWYKEKIKRVLDEGGDIIKVDLGELGADEALYHNGMDGREGHNFYTLEYQRVVYEATKEVKADDAMIWCRSGFIGSHKYPVHWGGDVACNFDNMAGQLRAVLSAGMSGFIFFSHDIGGFAGEPTPELYIRWFQFGMFTSHARAHGGARHEPWFYGQQAMDICKKFVELRYSLLPHIYSSAVECCIKGEPMVKALVLEYPEDLCVRNLDTEYLFCGDFLVAPMFCAEGSRSIYLPEGRWVDYWTREVLDGKRWIEYYCSLERIPLFVKAGSIIFKTDPLQYIENKVWDKVAVEIYADDSVTYCEKALYHGSRLLGKVSYKMENHQPVIDTKGIEAEIELRIIDVKYR